MNKFLNGNGTNTGNLTDQNLRQKKNADCRRISNENRKLKNLLKRAVEREFAPQHLIDSIKIGIRR